MNGATSKNLRCQAADLEEVAPSECQSGALAFNSETACIGRFGGFALPAMLERQHPVVASALLGMVWTIWHLPLYFSSAWSGAAHSFVWTLWSVIGLSIIMTWLYLKSQGSVIPAMLLHQGTNHIGNYFPQTVDVLPGGDDWQILRGTVYWIVAAALLVWTQGRLGVSRQTAQA